MRVCACACAHVCVHVCATWKLPSVSGELYGQESRTDTLMPSLKAVPQLSHLMGLASP